MIRILPTHQYYSAHSADDIASEIQVTRVKYNQYALCRLNVLAKWLTVKEELSTLPKHMNSPPVFNGVRVTQSLVNNIYFL